MAGSLTSTIKTIVTGLAGSSNANVTDNPVQRQFGMTGGNSMRQFPKDANPGVAAVPSAGTEGSLVGDYGGEDIPTAGNLLFSVPDWGYQDFLTERAVWQKQLDSISSDPGWFYFKIFFNFSSPSGLLGGILRHPSGRASTSYDTAARYLTNNLEHYSRQHLDDRLSALKRFVRTLSFISSEAPWFFESIDGLAEACMPDLSQPLRDRAIEIGLKEDAVDMRLTTMLDMYRYAAYDMINLKEVIPQNLRQFEMSVILFHTPIRWYQTGMQTMRRGTFQYKNLNADNGDERMSYKMFTFKGCEFDVQTFGQAYPAAMSNTMPVSLGKSKVRITYKRCYQHTFNEWGRFGIGDDGIYYEAPLGTTASRSKAISDGFDNPYYYNPGAEIYKSLVDATEAKISGAMRLINPASAFGNLYLGKTHPDSEYFREKMRTLKEGSPVLHGGRKR